MQINRRALLRGIGTSLGLPMMEAMMEAMAAPAKAPCRMAFLYVPNGIMMDQWIPDQKTGVTPLPMAFPKVTSALAKYREDILLSAD